MKKIPAAAFKLLLATALLIAGESVRAGDETVYVVYIQAVKAQLKSEPRMNASNVVELERGAELKVVEKKDVWYKVSSADGKQGWVSKLFVNTHRPVGAASLNTDVKDNIEKASRRRTAAAAVSASTRGLAASDRVREGRELYQSDFEALKQVEEQKVDQGELDNFQRSAKLSE